MGWDLIQSPNSRHLFWLFEMFCRKHITSYRNARINKWRSTIVIETQIIDWKAYSTCCQIEFYILNLRLTVCQKVCDNGQQQLFFRTFLRGSKCGSTTFLSSRIRNRGSSFERGPARRSPWRDSHWRYPDVDAPPAEQRPHHQLHSERAAVDGKKSELCVDLRSRWSSTSN